MFVLSHRDREGEVAELQIREGEVVELVKVWKHEYLVRQNHLAKILLVWSLR